MPSGDILRAFIGRSIQTSLRIAKRSRRAAVQQQLANAVRCGVEPLEKRTMLTGSPTQLYWDSNAAGSASTWDTSTAEWQVGSATGSPVAWSNLGDSNGSYEAVFPAGTGAVTLGASISAAAISFSAGNNTTLAGGSAGDVLSLTGISTLDVASGSTASITAAIAAPSGVIKTSPGTLNLNGTVLNTATAELEVQQGSLSLSGGQTWATVAVDAAGTLIIQGSGADLSVSNSMIVDGLVDHLGGQIQASMLNVDSTGIFSDQSGGLSGSNGSLTINNNGVFASTVSQSLNGSTGSFNNSGFYEVDNGGSSAGVTTLSMNFNQGTGTIEVTAGTLSLPGTLSFQSGANFNFSGPGSLSVPILNDGSATVQQWSGLIDVTNSMTVGSGAQYDLIGGTLYANSLSVGGSMMQSGGSLFAGHTEIGTFGNATLTQTGGASSYWQLILGYYGVGLFSLSGGTCAVNNYLLDGENGQGTLDLSGNATLSSPQESIGNYAGNVGTFNQSGNSTNTAGLLDIGNYGTGQYLLSGNGLLDATWEYIGNTNNGYAASGSFIQTGGGQNAYNGLLIGNNSGATGNYTITGGVLGMTTTQLGVDGGVGSFNQTGGSVYEYGSILAGVGGGSATIHLSGGSLSLTQNLYVGYSSVGSLSQSGTSTVSSTNIFVSGDGWDGDAAGMGSYTLTGNANLSSQYMYVGYTANGTFTQVGASASFSGALILSGPRGTVGTYNNQSAGSLTGTVINVLIPSAGGTGVATEGSPYTLNLSATGAPTNDAIANWKVLWGDATSNWYSGASVTTTHTYDAASTDTINATAYTSQGDSFTTPAQSVIIADVPANISPISNQTVNTGSSLSISTTFTDPGTLETHTALVNWGDGNTSTGTITESDGSGTISATHTYLVHGNYTAEIEVTDSGGAIGIASFNVSATYVAPVVSIIPSSGPIIATESTTVGLDANGPESSSISSWMVQWGDGTTQTIPTNQMSSPTINGFDSTWSLSHTYATPGSYIVLATATDSVGTHATPSKTLVVQPPPGLVVEVLGTNGSTSATATSVGQVIPLQVWAVVSGTSSNGANDGIQSVAGSFISSMASDNSVHGNLSDSLSFLFNAYGAQAGTQQNLNGDGNLDVGSDGSTETGYFDARSGGIATGTVSNFSDKVLIANLNYTVTSLASGGETDVNFFLRQIEGPGFAAVWQQDGQAENDTTSTLSAGAPFRINAGSEPVVPATITPDLTPFATPIVGGGLSDSLSGSTVVALAGSGNFAVSFASGEYTFTQNTDVIATVLASDLAGFTFTGGDTAPTLAISGSGGDPILLNDAGSDGTVLSITVAAGSGVTFNTTEHLLSLTIDSGATATMSANGQSVLVTNSLSIAGSSSAWTGTLDLTDNGMIVSSGDLATITNQLQSGYHAGGWNGPGIDSSSATQNGYINSLGVISNQESGTAAWYSTFDGQAVSASDVLVQYTYYGDLNLDGAVDGNDYSLLDNGYSSHLTGWMNGDVNYDGVVDGSDYTLVETAFNKEGPPIVDPGTGVLPAPRNLTASMFSSSQINLSWIDDASAPDAPFDLIYESANGGATFTQIGATDSVPAGSENTYSASGLIQGEDYEFYVISSGANIASSSSNTVSQATTFVPPTLAVEGSGTVEQDQPYTLELTANYPNGESASIQSWTVNWGDGSTDTYTSSDGVDPNPAMSVCHIYASSELSSTITVTAKDGVHTPFGPITATVTITPVTPPAPTDFEATESLPGEVDLSWSESVTFAGDFIVTVSPPGGSSTTYDVDSDTFSYAAVGLPPDTTYGFSVTANAQLSNGLSSSSSPATLSASASKTSLTATGPATEIENVPAELELSSGGSSNITGWTDSWEDSIGNSISVDTVSGTSGSDAYPTGADTFAGFSATVSARDSAGFTFTLPELFLQSELAAPTFDSATEVSPSEIDLVWSNNSSFAQNIIIYDSTDGTNFIPLTTVNAGQTTFQANGLLASTTYTFELVAQDDNLDGSAASNTKSCTTPADPWNIVVAGTTTTAAENLPYQLSIVASPVAGAPTLDHYVISWGDNTANTTYRPGDPAPSHTFASGTQYSTVSVIAYTPDGAVNPLAVTAPPILLDVVPTAPQNVQMNVISSTEVDVMWTDESQAVTGYEVLASVNGAAYTEVGTVDAGTDEYQYETLDPSTQVNCEVEAFDSNGLGVSTADDSTFSPPVACISQMTTYTGVPIITSVQVGPVGTNTVIVNWAYQGDDDEGFEIEAEDVTADTNFQNYVNPGPLDDSGEGTTTITLPNASDIYNFRMRADHTDGTVSAYTSNSQIQLVPNAPSNFYRIYGGGTWADVRWYFPAQETATLTGFKIYNGMTLVSTASPTDTDTIISNLSPSTAYELRIVAVNQAGSSGPANTSFTTFAYDIDEPEGVSVISAGGNTTFSWGDTNIGTNHPDANPSAFVQELVGGGSPINIQAGNGYVDQGVSYSASAVWRARAMGPSYGGIWVSQSWSDWDRGTTDDPESAPTQVAVAATGPGTIEVGWIPASNAPGSLYDSFVIPVWVATTGYSAPNIQIQPGPTTGNEHHMSAFISGLVPGVKYLLTVYAQHITESGETNFKWGPIGKVVSVTAIGTNSIPLSVPAAPSNLTGVYDPSTPGGYITVNWTDNSNDESGFQIATIVGNNNYQIIGDVAPDQTKYGEPPLPYDHGSTTGNGPWTYAVRSFNAAGYSDWATVTVSAIGGPDITDHLIKILSDLRARATANPVRMRAAFLSDPTNNWDITLLFRQLASTPDNSGILPNGSHTVTVNGRVYLDAEVNYWLYGIWTRLIGIDYDAAFTAVLVHGSTTVEGPLGKLAWFNAGWNSSFFNATSAAIPNVLPAMSPPLGGDTGPLWWHLGEPGSVSRMAGSD